MSILPYSSEAYASYYAPEFLANFDRTSLATGLCDSKQSEEFVRTLNLKSSSGITFNFEMLTQNQLSGGACSAVAFRVIKKALHLLATLRGSGLGAQGQRLLFSAKFTNLVQELNAVAISKRKEDKEIQVTIRSEQLALNTITVDRNQKKEGGDYAVPDKIESMAPFYHLRVVESYPSIKVDENPELKMQLEDLFKTIKEGVYLLRIIVPKNNHKLEEKGHSIVLIKNDGVIYYFETQLGAYLLSNDISGFLFNTMLSAKQTYKVDQLSVHRLDEVNSIYYQTIRTRALVMGLMNLKPLEPHLKASSPTIIFSPALGRLTEAYRPLLEQLCIEGFQVIFVDFTRTGSGTLNLDEDAIIERAKMNSDDLTQLVGELDVPSGVKIGVMGHSIGGSASVLACGKTKKIAAAINLDGRILNPLEVTLPLLQVVATEVKENRDVYNSHLNALLERNPAAKKVEIAAKHEAFATEDPKLIKQIMKIVLAFFHEHLKGEV